MTSAVCHGAATIIAAFATGKGGAFGLDLHTKATVELDNTGKIKATIGGNPKEDTRLIEYCVKDTLQKFGLKNGATIETESNIPIAAGLKSSSVAANAAVLATAGAIAERHGEIREVRISKTQGRQELEINGRTVDPLELINVGVNAALKAKVTVTGAFDDASASYLGGYTVTDNRSRRILRKGDMESMNAVILVPKKRIYTTKADLNNIKLIKNSVNAAWNLAMEGDIYTAMTLNGLLHSLAFNMSTEPQLEAMRAGAAAAGLSGKGPAVVALARGDTKEVKKALSRFGGDIIEAKTNNAAARVTR